MAYHQTGLDGSGTEADPFLIKSYSDWRVIDATRDIGDPAPHYKLTTDLNMPMVRRKWKGADFLGGYLDMDNHTITSPILDVNEYLMHRCILKGGELERLSPSGKVQTPGGEGKITGVTGTHVEPLLDGCSISRVYLDIDAEDMWVDDEDESLTGDIIAEQCYISIHNEGFFDKPLISVSTGENFKDCCFEFTGKAYDISFISGSDLVMDHCMVRGDVDCSEMKYAYTSTNAYIVTGAVSSCIFDLKAKGAKYQQGFIGYATAVSSAYGPTIAVKRDGLYVYNRSEHEHGESPVKVIEADIYRSPDALIELGFDVKKLR